MRPMRGRVEKVGVGRQANGNHAPIAKSGDLFEKGLTMLMQRARLNLTLVAALICSLAAGIAAARADGCTGTPAQAVMELPQPLARWGQIICTPYGHIISSHPGWVWSNVGSYSPVMIPAQMVVDHPASTGNLSYFTKIAMVEVKGDKYYEIYNIFHSHLGPDGALPKAFRLDVDSVPGPPVTHLTLYFFDYGASAWGMWCPHEKCDPTTNFMILDMARSPDGR